MLIEVPRTGETPVHLELGPKFDPLRQEIQTSLKLEQRGITDPLVAREIMEQITQGVVNSQLKLEIPLPGFDLITNWGSGTAAEVIDGRVIIGDLLYHNGAAIVRYSPHYLFRYLHEVYNKRLSSSAISPP